MDSHVYPDWYVGSAVTWSHQIQYTVALHLCVGTVVYPDYPLKVFLIVTWIKYQDRSGAGFVTTWDGFQDCPGTLHVCVWAGSFILITPLKVFLIVTWNKYQDRPLRC